MPDWIAFGIISAGVILHMVIIGWAGFIIASHAAVRPGRARLRQQAARARRDHRRRARHRRVPHLHARAGLEAAQGSVRRELAVDTFGALLSGFAVALTWKNLIWGFLGVTLGTAIGVLPGVGPALTIALLLPATASLDPDRRADHVRRHLLRRDVRRLDDVDPAQHAGRIGDDRHRARRQPDGQARPRRDPRWRPPRSARSSRGRSRRSCSR